MTNEAVKAYEELKEIRDRQELMALKEGRFNDYDRIRAYNVSRHDSSFGVYCGSVRNT